MRKSILVLVLALSMGAFCSVAWAKETQTAKAGEGDSTTSSGDSGKKCKKRGGCDTTTYPSTEYIMVFKRMFLLPAGK